MMKEYQIKLLKENLQFQIRVLQITLQRYEKIYNINKISSSGHLEDSFEEAIEEIQCSK